MIPVTRAAPPNVLQQLGACWLTALRAISDELEQVENDSQATPQQIRRAKERKKRAQNKYRHSKIKNALLTMFHGKCAYCESPIMVVAYGHIEHFYPKGNPNYVDKTFEWDNLLLSCAVCNDSGHKGTRFPLDASGNPLLIDPTDGVTDPGVHLKFSWDPRTGLASVYGLDERGQEVERMFDLNGMRGRKALIRERSRYVKKLYVILKLYDHQGNNAEALAILQQACQPNAPYSAFALAHIAPHIFQTVEKVNERGRSCPD